MYLLRLINDEGEVIREVESDTPWLQRYTDNSGTSVGMPVFVGFADGGERRIYPADHLTVETAASARELVR